MGLLALPSLWDSRDPMSILRTVLEMLARMLDLDLAYARLDDGAVVPAPELARSEHLTDIARRADEVGAVIEPWLLVQHPSVPYAVQNSFQQGELRVTHLWLGVRKGVLQEHEFERLGSAHTQKSDVRLIAASNRDPVQMVADRTFRDDLYYRLKVCPIETPPLRRRVDDIPMLAQHFLQVHALPTTGRSRPLPRKAWRLSPGILGRATCANCRTSSSAA